ncbi:palmitoyltransferase ZDHHC4-like [Branchiostoma floridae x Branchiostoma japonicum]
MDFLLLSTLYLTVFIILTYVLWFGDSSFHRRGYVGKLRRTIITGSRWCFHHCLPSLLRRQVENLWQYAAYTRNPLFQCLYAILVLAGFSTFQLDVLHYAALYESPALPLYQKLPLYILCVNAVLFCALSMGDPGVIVKGNVERHLELYEFDGQLYRQDEHCRTCQFEKPARSKHCAFCNHCVYRFDHHCLWVNCCIGGLNHRLFLGFLVTLCCLCGYISYATWKVALLIVEANKLWSAHYVDRYGRPQPMDLRTLCQYLFMQHPRMIFLLVSLSLLTLLLVGFTLYHLYLTLNNVTTNELYKKPAPQQQQQQQQHQLQQQQHDKNNAFKGKGNQPKMKQRKPLVEEARQRKKKFAVQSQCHRWNPYHRGHFQNIFEVLWPLTSRRL